MIELRDYQEEIIFHLLKSELPRESIQLATGGGKTVLFSTCMALKARKGESSLLLVNREELMDQAKKTLIKNFNIFPFI